jgi:multidrug resistance protein, MATE family
MREAATRTNGSGIGREAAATMLLALPLMAGQLFAMGMNVVDIMLAGHLGAHVLSAVAIGTSIWSLAVMTLAGLMMALPPTVAQLDGAKRRDLVAPLFRQALYLAMTAGVLLMVLIHWGGPLLAGAIGVPRDVAADVAGFLHAVSFGAPGLALYFACRGFSEGLSVTRTSMAVGAGGVLLLIPVGYALMYGVFGLPGLGALGSGAASSIICWGLGLFYAAIVRFAPLYPGVEWGNGRRGIDWRAIRSLLRLGLPMTASVLMEVGLFSAAGLVIGRLGEVAVAGHQIALNVAGLAFMVPLGLSIAITVRVGNAVGRHDPEGVRRAGLVGIALVLATQLCSSVVMFGVPGLIATLYTDDAQVAAAATGLLLLAGVFQFPDGIQVAANGALRGIKDTRVPMAITAFAYWGVGMPVAWWLGFPAGLGARGVWLGLVAGLAVAAVLLFARFVRLTRSPRRVAAIALG